MADLVSWLYRLRDRYEEAQGCKWYRNEELKVQEQTKAGQIERVNRG